MELYTEHRAGIVQVRLPLPFPLRWVNGYLIRDRRGWALLDPGLHTESTEQAWTETFAKLGVATSDVHAIIVTHHHPDHYGFAGKMQQWTGAPVYMADKSYAQTQRLWGPNHREFIEQLLLFFRANGLPKSYEETMRAHFLEFVALVSPQPEVQSLASGQTIYLGDEPYEMFEANGHAFGHLCFYGKQSRQLFCGDHVMPNLSPNVAYFPNLDENPLHSYVTSLRAIQSMSVEIAYPGHRDPFRNWSERIAQLLRHHEARLDWFCQYLSDGRPHTAFDCCEALFGQQLSIHQFRFALMETIAHLIFLAKERKIKVFGSEQINYQGEAR